MNRSSSNFGTFLNQRITVPQDKSTYSTIYKWQTLCLFLSKSPAAVCAFIWLPCCCVNLDFLRLKYTEHENYTLELKLKKWDDPASPSLSHRHLMERRIQIKKKLIVVDNKKKKSSSLQWWLFKDMRGPSSPPLNWFKIVFISSELKEILAILNERWNLNQFVIIGGSLILLHILGFTFQPWLAGVLALSIADETTLHDTAATSLNNNPAEPRSY